jgi:hypothetical protein
MPIKLTPSSPEPDEGAQERQDAAQHVAEIQQREEQEQSPKRTRRSKAQMIADAVVPADDAPTAIKDLGTGAKIERPWSEAVALVKDGKAEFVDKSLKYAVMKAEQQAVSSAFGQQDEAAISDEARENNRRAELESLGQVPTTDAFGRPSPEQLEAAQLPTDGSGQMVAPEGAEHGDEVRIGTETYRVGPGGTLVKGVVDAPAKRRWQRELGAGADGPWESIVVGSSQNGNGEPAFALPQESAPAELNIETERLPRTVEVLGNGMVKIGTGILEKIGMPQIEQFSSASQFQIGPISISREVLDDGRRSTVIFSDGRKGEVITAAVEGFDLLDNTVEFIAARFRGQLYSFLVTIGAAKQPVS